MRRERHLYCVTPLQPAALVFTEVVYGNRPGTPERYAVVVAADDAARTARVAV